MIGCCPDLKIPWKVASAALYPAARSSPETRAEAAGTRGGNGQRSNYADRARMLRVCGRSRLFAPRSHPLGDGGRAKEIRARKFDAYLGSNRMCDIGLNLATGQDYTSFVFLLDELTCPL
jgi:hypothetical protein